MQTYMLRLLIHVIIGLISTITIFGAAINHQTSYDLVQDLPSKSSLYRQQESHLQNDNSAPFSKLRLKRSPVKKFYEFGSKRASYDDGEDGYNLDKRFYDFGVKKRFYDFGVKRASYIPTSDYFYDKNNDYSKRFYEFGSKRTTE
ncbi:unnamed protein product [Didymodactylos carnosus]|uniref:Uncharacterized protein n=1 Tax=Didymodactylos carnosus TaxID=1234261 RepID=A0A813UJ48_9BILA|nr:unnamed protein product [Didymodactylos carnosus]CAF0828396.1 unnamed protein product [Didymodactylos carnosus]CAF3568114.1 unnamed protein product [Didymodactylos carnosus]CAF3615347.1 unnamed protein product [Didymodactylos carnosus]